MTLYVDTSVILRWVLGQRDGLPHPSPEVTLVTSRLTTVERAERDGKGIACAAEDCDVEVDAIDAVEHP